MQLTYIGLEVYSRPRIFSIHLFILLTVAGVFNVNTLNAEELRAHPRSIVFNAVQGHALSDTRSIFIFTTGGNSLNWTRTKNASWITTNLTSGSTEGVLNVSVNVSGLAPGVYNGNVYINSPQSTIDPVDVAVTLIVNPDVPVKITTWKDGVSGAMSVSVDDSQPSGFDELQANGFKGTYVLEGETPKSFYTDYYNAGMELGSHTVHHLCYSVDDNVFRTQEIEPNIYALCHLTPIPCNDVVTLVWPCGSTNYREEDDASDYFLSARGYNINQLEDSEPENFMNLKSFNSHEHFPFPPEDLKTMVDAAIVQKKWFNLVLHDFNNDDGATSYANGKDIWVTSIGSVIKYIFQRDRFIVSAYSKSTAMITCNVSRLEIPGTSIREFENAFHPQDLVTMEIDIDDNKIIDQVLVAGTITPYSIVDISGNKVLRINVRLEPTNSKSVEIRFNTAEFTLSISGVTVSNKTYDGTTSATLHKGSATLVGIQSGDNVTLITSGGVGSFENKSAGQSKTVITSGFTLGGTDASKYVLIQPVLAANITRLNLIISGVTANDKYYDGTTVASLDVDNVSFSGVIGGDNVALVSSAASGTFSDKNAGANKDVTISGLSTGGPDGGNYNLAQPSASADILAIGVTLSGITADNKVYDATTSASLNTSGATLSGIRSGDVVTLGQTNVTGSFQNKDAATGKQITLTGFSLNGSDRNNYYLILPTVTASITKANLNISGVTALNKVYNATLTGQLNSAGASVSGVLTGDIVNLVSTGATGIFDNKNVGTGKQVTTSGFTLSGTDRNNYSLVQQILSADITKATTTVSGVSALNKIYDGTTSASLNTAGGTPAGIFGGDNVSINSSSATGIFANKNVGVGITVSTTGFTLGGADAGNYTVIQPALTASITTRPLTVTANDLTKSYGTTLIFKSSDYRATGLVPGDLMPVVTLSSSGASSSASVGTYPISVANGSDHNYSYTYVSGSLRVNRAAVTIKADDKVKPYGSLNPALTLSYSGFINGDGPSDLTIQPVVSTTASVTSAVGSYPIILSSCSDDNYDIILNNGSLVISKIPLTITAENQTRGYREVNPELTISYSGFIAGDDQNKLDTKPVILTDAEIISEVGSYDISVSGASSANYLPIYKKGILTITKANQFISFEKIPDKLRMTQDFTLNATASSGLNVNFELSDPMIADLNNNVLKIKSDGSLNVKAIQEGDRNWNPAPDNIQSLIALPTFDNISSLFTPNNDGMNDYWFIPELEKYGKLQVTVFNRYGQGVYKSDSYKNDWDGTWNSKQLPTASYYYIINSSKLGMIKGVVNIAR